MFEYIPFKNIYVKNDLNLRHNNVVLEQHTKPLKAIIKNTTKGINVINGPRNKTKQFTPRISRRAFIGYVVSQRIGQPINLKC